MNKQDFLYKAFSPEDFKDKEELLTRLGMTFDTSGNVWFLLHLSAPESHKLIQEYDMILSLDEACMETQ